ncbi:MAG: conjugal transfer protein TraO [Bacteroidales bacterium]|nr:conjugal transfer protein TraO [Bacteroidales bacterium]
MIILITCASLPVMAQRYLPGMKGIQVAGGIIERNGYFVHAAYSKYTKSQNRLLFDMEYLQRNYAYENEKIPVMQFTGEAGYYLRFFSDGTQSFFLAFGAHIGTGYETVNLNKKRLTTGAMITNQDRWIYGGAVALEAEYYLDDKYVLLLFAKERLYGGSSVAIFHTQLGLGIKFILD